MPMRGGFRTGVIAVAGVLLAGCGGGGGGGDVTSTGAQATAAVNAPPAPETRTVEAPQAPAGDATAIEVASLPVGGDVSGDTAELCAHVSWVGPNPIPPAVSVTLAAFGLTPGGLVRFGGRGCGSGGPACTTRWRWKVTNSDVECLLPMTQVVDVESEQTVTLVLTGRVRCPDPQTCADFTHLGGSQLRFAARPGVVSPASGGSDSSAPGGAASVPPPSGGNGSVLPPSDAGRPSG